MKYRDIKDSNIICKAIRATSGISTNYLEVYLSKDNFTIIDGCMFQTSGMYIEGDLTVTGRIIN